MYPASVMQRVAKSKVKAVGVLLTLNWVVYVDG